MVGMSISKVVETVVCPLFYTDSLDYCTRSSRNEWIRTFRSLTSLPIQWIRSASLDILGAITCIDETIFSQQALYLSYTSTRCSSQAFRSSKVKVSVDDLDVAMELGNNGIILSVYGNDDTYRGKLRVGKGTVEWCRGKTRMGNGVKVNWNDLISFFEDD